MGEMFDETFCDPSRGRRSAPLFELHDAIVRRDFKDILTVDDFALDFGENIALLGPNGAGKSTFIKLMTREILPLYRDNPPVRFMGNPRATLEDVKKQLGVVSATMQDQITVHVPAFEIVLGGLFGTLGLPRHCGVSEEAKAKALEAMETLHVADLKERDIMTLSSGQARRVLIARALVHNPQVIVFDEPCTGLDPQGMYHVRQSLRALAQAGKTVVLVTHYPEDIIPEIGRILMIKEGAVFADCEKEEAMTDARLSSLFGIPMNVIQTGPYYSIACEY